MISKTRLIPKPSENKSLTKDESKEALLQIGQGEANNSQIAAFLMGIQQKGITVDELGAFIPHQANFRIIEAMARQMDIPDSVVIADDIKTNGNTSAASIPLAMDRILEEHPELHGKLALLIGYGAGLVYAGQVVELPPKP